MLFRSATGSMIGVATSRRPCRDPDSQLRSRVGACWLVALMSVCCGSSILPSPALAGWERAVAVHGPADQEVVFDSRDAPWVAFGGETSAPSIARLTSRYGLAAVRGVPAIPGQEVTEISDWAVNAAGVGDMVLDYRPSLIGEEKVPPDGIAVAEWRPGHSIGKPIELADDAYRGPAMAVGPSGTAVVLWVGFDQEVHSARVRSGRLLGRQEVQIAGGHVPNSMEVLNRPTGGFLASWSLRAGGHASGSSEFELVGVDDVVASGAGIFDTPFLSPWPLASAPAVGVSEANLISDARGDQAALWSIEQGENDGIGEDIYVASRRAGEPFGAPQLIGRGDLPELRSRLLITPGGRISVLWPDSSERLRFAVGYAGHPLKTGRYVWPSGSGQRESHPLAVMSTHGMVIALWAIDHDSSRAAIVVATSTDGRRFSKPRRISVDGSYIHGCSQPSLLAPDRQGGALAAWSCTYHRHETINEYARYRP
jgi:hypothetical protein